MLVPIGCTGSSSSACPMDCSVHSSSVCDIWLIDLPLSHSCEDVPGSCLDPTDAPSSWSIPHPGSIGRSSCLDSSVWTRGWSEIVLLHSIESIDGRYSSAHSDGRLSS